MFYTVNDDVCSKKVKKRVRTAIKRAWMHQNQAHNHENRKDNKL